MSTKIFYGRKDGILTYSTDSTDMQVFQILTVGEDQDLSDVLDYLRTVVGKDVPSKPFFSWEGDETYRKQESRDRMRAAVLAPAKVVEKVEVKTETVEELVSCSCGHTVSKSLVMSTSTGSSCPDCFDRMSV